MTVDTRWVWPFDAGTEPDRAQLGGKCGSLVSMTNAGLPVPPGFAVTTTSYHRAIRDAGVSRGIRAALAGLDPRDVAAVDATSRLIRDEILGCEVPDAVQDATLEALSRLTERCGGEVPVAVRSSATAEDLADASFAGQQDTYLWLMGDASVREHIRRCWASLYTSRAISYRLKNDISDEGLSMAVAVQKMANASRSGVAITMDPTNGDRSKITIDASYGLGELVVSGKVTPDNIMLDKVTLQLVGEHVGDKHAELVHEPGSAGLVERPVAPQRADVRCLTDEELRTIALMAKRCERHYGCPQDIEWALDADLPAGQDLVLLQSRPETIHSNQPRPAGLPTGPAPHYGARSLAASLLDSGKLPASPIWPVRR